METGHTRKEDNMKRKILKLKRGFAFVDADGGGRYIGKDGEAFDLDPEKHSELIKKVLAEGESCVGALKQQKPEQLTLL